MTGILPPEQAERVTRRLLGPDILLRVGMNEELRLQILRSGQLPQRVRLAP